MNGDQPNKLRVVGTRERAVGVSAPAANPDPATAAHGRREGARGSPLLPALLFLIAAAVSGAAVAYLRVTGLLP